MPQAEIHAFEPDPDAFADLTASYASAAVLVPAAVSDAEGIATLHRTTQSISNSLLEVNEDSSWYRHAKANKGFAPTDTVDVPTLTLDGYCATHGIDRVTLLKVDTQGWEPDVLRGASELLRRAAIDVVQVEIIMGELYARTLAFADVEDILGPAGYRLWTLPHVATYCNGRIRFVDAVYLSPRFWATQPEPSL
jgi:FkbM family methyltransferase